jgi:hypothetical protein
MKYSDKRMHADPIGALGVPHRGQLQGSYRGGRVCPVPGCGARLSRYAPGILCAFHADHS